MQAKKEKKEYTISARETQRRIEEKLMQAKDSLDSRLLTKPNNNLNPNPNLLVNPLDYGKMSTGV